MDTNHQLDAPNNEDLGNIEQVADHSGLTTLYPHAKAQWDGEILSEEERERRRKYKEDTVSFGIRKHFVTIGFLAPLPLIIASVVVTGVFTMITDDNVRMFVIPMIVVFLLWVMFTIGTYKKLTKLFYTNAVQAGPFLFTLLLLLGMSLPMIFTGTLLFQNEQPLISASLIGGVEIIWSIILTLPLIYIWTTPKLRGNSKFALITAIALTLLGVALYILFNETFLPR